MSETKQPPYHDKWKDLSDHERLNKDRFFTTSEYKLSFAVQELVLSHLLQDTDGIKKYRDIIQPQYFSNGLHTEIASYFLTYYDRYKKPPRRLEFLEYVRIQREMFELYSSGLDEYLDEIDRLYGLEYDPEFLDEQIIRFARSQAVYNAMVAMIGDVTSGKTEKFDEHIRNLSVAAHIGDDSDESWLDMRDGFKERREKLKETSGIEEETTPYSLGMGDDLDSTLKGGFARKELELIIAPTGVGKSSAMQNIGASLVSQGLDILHISLENKASIAEHIYAAILTRVNKDDVYSDVSDDIFSVLEEAMKTGKYGNITIAAPVEKFSTMTLRSMLEKYKLRYGKYPDAVILDYLALMAPTRSHKDAKYLEEDELARELKQMSREYNLIMITASQTNRTGEGKSIVDLSNIATSYGIPTHADIAISLSGTKEEREKGIIHGFIPKSRNSKSQVYFDGTANYAGNHVISLNFGKMPETDEEGRPAFHKKRKKQESTDRPWSADENAA